MLKHTFFTIFVLLACWVALMEGTPSSDRRRCFCKDSRNYVNKNRIAKTDFHQPNTACNREELIVTLKNNQKICLNVDEKQGKELKQTFMKSK